LTFALVTLSKPFSITILAIPKQENDEHRRREESKALRRRIPFCYTVCDIIWLTLWGLFNEQKRTFSTL
jgi:hypothetical protein